MKLVATGTSIALGQTLFCKAPSRIPTPIVNMNGTVVNIDFYRGRNHVWNEDHDIMRIGDTSEDKLSMPKPDICLGFRLRSVADGNPPGFWGDDSVQNFSVDTLGALLILDPPLVSTTSSKVQKHLEKKGRQFASPERQRFNRSRSDDQPTIEAGVDGETAFSKDYLLCFPWAIIELKHENVGRARESEGRNQGANGAARALRMFENLSRYADSEEQRQQVPPIVVMTFVGPIFKLWIAFLTLNEDGNTNYVRSIVSIFGIC